MADSKLSALTAITYAELAATDLFYISDISAGATKKLAFSELSTQLATYATLASPTFTGTVSGITAAMVGLTNVDNTSDANKPVSTATQTALNLKANLASPTFTGTVSGITATMVGLGSVVNADTTTTANITDSSNKRFVTDALLTILGNTSGTNTGDNATNSQYSGLAASKQDTLVSATNIKTVNSTSLLGSGDVAVQATLVSATNIKTINGSSILGSGDLSVSGSSTLAQVSAAANDTAKSLYTMTTTVNINFERSAGASLLYLSEASGRIGVNNNAPSATHQVNSTATGEIVQIIKAFSGQTANIIEYHNSSNVAMGGVSKNGVPFSYGGNLSSTSTAYGAGTMAGNSTGIGNTGFGNAIMISGALTGQYNSAFGDRAGGKISSGSYTVSVGGRALGENTTGDYGIGIGYYAGRNIVGGANHTDGTSGIYIGAYTKASAATQTNEIVIGDSAEGNGSNTITLGHTTNTKTFLRGSTMIPTLADGSAANSSLYYSSTAGKLVWKDSGGTVNNLY